MKRAVAAIAAAAILLVGAAPAAPPEYPASFISVDELKTHLDRGGRADIIDVRRWDAYTKLHIEGARSMPIRSIQARANEITKTGLAVFY